MGFTTGRPLQNGKYSLGPVLGQRKLSITYRATQTPGGSPVVIKMLHETLKTHPEFTRLQQQFVTTGQRLLQCRHPNLVETIELFEEEGMALLVMEEVQGQSLEAVVAATGPLPETMALDYLRQAGAALELLHQNHLVHQDVQPRNLIRCLQPDRIVVTNLGTIGDQVGYVAAGPYALPGDRGSMMDVYGLAATLYYLLMGQPPLIPAPQEEGPVLTSSRDPAYLLARLRQFHPGLSPQTEQALLRGLALGPDPRISRISDWLALLPQETMVGTVKTQMIAPQANGSVQKVSDRASHKGKGRLPRALVLTSLVAIALGAGAGFAVRFSVATGTGPALLNPEQSFPARDNWPGTVPAEASSPAQTLIESSEPLAPSVRREVEAPESVSPAEPNPIPASRSRRQVEASNPEPKPELKASPLPAAESVPISAPASPESLPPVDPLPPTAPIEPLPPSTPEPPPATVPDVPPAPPVQEGAPAPTAP
ncbi:MAG: protein kinase [Leptolyngbyaceae cyanobacterium bins.59]|nr:protein kinase [Leptolyngbyaceae cyanobacterium bins.59]